MVKLSYIEVDSSATLGSILYINTDNDNGHYGVTAGGSTKTELTDEKCQKKLGTNDDVKVKYVTVIFTNTNTTAGSNVEKYECPPNITELND